MKLKIAVLPGDGIGPEVMTEAIGVLKALNLDLELHDGLVGGIAIDTYGVALRDEELNLAQTNDAVLFGAVGTPKHSDPRALVRPEPVREGVGEW